MCTFVIFFLSFPFFMFLSYGWSFWLCWVYTVQPFFPGFYCSVGAKYSRIPDKYMSTHVTTCCWFFFQFFVTQVNRNKKVQADKTTRANSFQIFKIWQFVKSYDFEFNSEFICTSVFFKKCHNSPVSSSLRPLN